MATRDGSGDVSLSELFSCLQHPYRRRLLVDLLGGGPVVPEGGEAPRAVIHHIHLPKRHERNVIAWERHRAMVHQGSRYDQVAPFLGLMEAHADALPQEWV